MHAMSKMILRTAARRLETSCHAHCPPIHVPHKILSPHPYNHRAVMNPSLDLSRSISICAVCSSLFQVW